MKKNVLASFTDVLLLPVTIVPRTTVAVGKAFGTALTTGGAAAVQGIAMLNPQRWGATASNNSNANGKNGYVTNFEKAGSDQNGTLFEIGEDFDDDTSPTVEKSHKRLQCECITAQRAMFAEMADLVSFRIGSFDNVNIHHNHNSAQHKQPFPLCIIFLYKSYDSSSLCLRAHLRQI